MIADSDRGIAQMLSDPDLVGDTLLFALCLRHVLDRVSDDDGLRVRVKTLDGLLLEVGEQATGDNPGKAFYWARRAVERDLPRYDPESTQGLMRCCAEMVRKGGQCSKPAVTVWIDREPATGESVWIGYCGRHLTSEVEALRDERQRLWNEHGKPVPPPNRGGVLTRYFTCDWDALWQRVCPVREPLDGAKEATPPKPALRVVRGE